MTDAQTQTAAAEPKPIGVPSVSIDELEADPHGVLRRYRAETPFIERQGAGFVVLRAKDIERLMKDARLGQPRAGSLSRIGIIDGALFDFITMNLVGLEGEAHAKLRSPLTRTFAARLITAMRPVIRARAEALIDALGDTREFDLVERFTSLIPATTIAGMLGLPEADVPHFTAVVYELSTFLGYTAGQDLPRIKIAAEELKAYAQKIVKDRRAQPRDDFMTQFIAAMDEIDATADETMVQIMFLIIAGTDTTRVAGTNLVSLLLQHRQQWDAVRNDPSLIPRAVAEALRVEPSVASLTRFSLEPIELDGKVIPKGVIVSLSMMSAMRDGAVYADPDKFDIFRTDSLRIHPVFGGGPHRCVGEALAKAELEESLAVLTQRLPGLRLVGAPPKIIGHAGIRRIEPMLCTAAAS